MDIRRHTLPASPPSQEMGGADAHMRLFGGRVLYSLEAAGRRAGTLDSRKYSWQSLERLLAEDNPTDGLAGAQKQSLGAVSAGHCLFLMTGQQPGLLGGPVLWLYKGLTCARLAGSLAKKLGRPVVPLFWVAGDDSDLAECNHVEVLERPPWEPGRVLSLPFVHPEEPLPVSERRVEARQLERLLDGVKGLWEPWVLEIIRECYPPGTGLARGFIRLARRFLGPEGVLFVNGYSPLFRQLARPRLQEVLFGWQRVEEAISAGAAAMAESGLKPRLRFAPGVVHAFDVSSGMRRRLFIQPSRGGPDRVYLGGNPARTVPPEALASLDLSQDVVSRPLAVDAVFPLLGHVLGPHELAYFAQLLPVFRLIAGEAPLVAPRMSAAILPEASLEEFALLGLDAGQLARLRPSRLTARLKERAWRESGLEEIFPENGWRDMLGQLEFRHFSHFHRGEPLEQFGRHFRAAWAEYRRALRNESFRAHRQDHRGLFARLRWLGNGLGQDRFLNIHSLLDALGPEGFDRYLQCLDPLGASEQIFTYG